MTETNPGALDALIENDNQYLETGAFSIFETTKRIVRGLVTPFGEVGTNPSGDFRFSAGTVTLPADPSTVRLTVEHGGFEIGHAVSLRETERGIEAEFAIDEGIAGDRFLSIYASGHKHSLSAEFGTIARRGIDVVSSTFTGVAAVVIPGFESAALFSAVSTDMAAGDETVIARMAADAEAAVAAATERIAEIHARLAALTETPEEAPASEDTDPEDTPSEEQEKEEFGMTESNTVIPGGVGSPAPAAPTLTANGLFSALARKDAAALATFAEGASECFAISNVQHSGPSAVTIGADTQVPQHVQEIWTRRQYQRKFIPLFKQETLSSFKVTGWKWDPAKSPTVAAYSGNTAEIPSNAIDTIPVDADARRIAGGHKLDRRYIDFGDQSVYASYFTQITESYSRVTDADILGVAVAGATAVAGGAATDKAMGAIVDGALAVIAAENTPSFAVVSPELYRDLLLTPKDDVLGYLSASLGLEDGNVAGFRILPGAVGTGKVLVGAKEALTVYELGGVPIRVEGLDPHHGAIDPALFGYLAHVINNASALALVTANTGA